MAIPPGHPNSSRRSSLGGLLALTFEGRREGSSNLRHFIRNRALQLPDSQCRSHSGIKPPSFEY